MVTEQMRKGRHERIFKEIYEEGIIQKEVLIARACYWWGCSRRTALEYIQVVCLGDKRVIEFKDSKKEISLKVIDEEDKSQKIEKEVNEIFQNLLTT
jgi:hypothetical protein